MLKYGIIYDNICMIWCGIDNGLADEDKDKRKKNKEIKTNKKKEIKKNAKLEINKTTIKNAASVVLMPLKSNFNSMPPFD